MSDYADASTDPKARRARQDRTWMEMQARVDNLVGRRTPFEFRANAVTLPRFVRAIVANFDPAQEYVAEGFADMEAFLDVSAIWEGLT